MYSRIISLLMPFTTYLSGIGSAQTDINTDNPNDATILDVFSENKGVLFPKITDTSSLQLTDGLLYYNESKSNYRNGLLFASIHHKNLKTIKKIKDNF